MSSALNTCTGWPSSNTRAGDKAEEPEHLFRRRTLAAPLLGVQGQPWNLLALHCEAQLPLDQHLHEEPEEVQGEQIACDCPAKRMSRDDKTGPLAPRSTQELAIYLSQFPVSVLEDLSSLD